MPPGSHANTFGINLVLIKVKQSTETIVACFVCDVCFHRLRAVIVEVDNRRTNRHRFGLQDRSLHRAQLTTLVFSGRARQEPENSACLLRERPRVSIWWHAAPWNAARTACFSHFPPEVRRQSVDAPRPTSSNCAAPGEIALWYLDPAFCRTAIQTDSRQ